MTYTPTNEGTPVNASAFTSLQLAIDATPDGGTLFLPAGDYALSGSGAQLLLISKAITIKGEGWGSRLVVDPAVSSTTDVIRVFSPAAEIVGLQLLDFAIVPGSGQPARHGVNLDSQLGTNIIADSYIGRVQIGQFGSAGLAMFGPTPPLYDGIFTSTVTDCAIRGGLLLDRAGDSLRILGNKFSGAGQIVVNLVGQGSNTAHGFVFMFNNVTCSGGIKVLNSWGGAISYNNIELYEGATGSNGAIIDLEGNSTIPPENFEVRGNYLGGGPSVPTNIRVNRMKATRIEGNMLPRGAGKTIVITSNGDRTQIVRNREQPYGELIVSWLEDSGTNTVVEYIHPNTGRLNFTAPVDFVSPIRIGGGAPLQSSTQTGTGDIVLSGSPTLTTPNLGAASATSLAIGGGVVLSSSSTVVQYLGEILTTAATSDTISDSRIQVGSHCMAVPINPTAAAMTDVYAATGTGVLTLFHPATAGAGFALFCSII